jgi:hypothetical protein
LFKQEELHELLENGVNAKELWDALHSSQHLAVLEAEPTGKNKGKKGKSWRGRQRKY